jgi:hypothetical protein
MPKLFTTNIKLPSIKALEHDDVVMENKSGNGGGKHLMFDIWDSTTDPIEDQKHLAIFVDKMMEYFKSAMKSVKIENYRVEHRVYIMNKEEKFIGKIHDDSCEYSVILYYRIDDGIVGGTLHFYDDDAKIILDSHTPKLGDLVILSGVHAIGELSATLPNSKRSILILQINSEP